MVTLEDRHMYDYLLYTKKKGQGQAIWHATYWSQKSGYHRLWLRAKYNAGETDYLREIEENSTTLIEA